MKRIFILFFALFTAILASAISVSTTNGKFSIAIRATGQNVDTITNLKVSGVINAKDIKFMRDSMPALTYLDMSGASIGAYTGTDGTKSTSSTSYSAYKFPDNAFYNASTLVAKTSLKSVILPSSTTLISTYAFYKCTGLTSVVFQTGLITISDYAFAYCSGLSSLNIPLTTTTFGKYTFSNCTGFTSVTLPTQLSLCGENAFANNPNLVTINLYSKSIGSLGTLANPTFEGCANVTTVNVGPEVTRIPHYAFKGFQKLTAIDLPAKVALVGEYAFSGCIALSNFTCTPSLDYVDEYAFYGCVNLTEFPIKNTIACGVGDYAFSGCTSLTHVALSALSGSLSEKAFQNCPNLSSIYFNIVDAGNGTSYCAFDLSPSITKLTIGEDVKTIPRQVFYSLTGIQEVVLPPSVLTIYSEAFIYCNGIKSFRMSPFLQIIQPSALVGCTSISTLTIPRSVYLIQEAAFGSCVGLRKVYAQRATPLAITSSVFVNVDKTKCTLYVPKGTASIYSTTSVWMSFVNIVEVDTAKTLNISAGNLATALSADEKEMINSLKISGTIDARDIYFMRDSLPGLSSIDLSEANIVAYTGVLDSVKGEQTFVENTLPVAAFKKKAILFDIQLPASLTAIGDSAFYKCNHLDSISVYNETPIDLSSSVAVFDNVLKTSCKLMIPPSSASTYAVSAVWKDFIVEQQIPTSTTEATSSKFKLSTDNNKLMVTELPIGETLRVYNVQGSMVYSQTITTESISLTLPQRGVYLVVVGENVEKVIY